MKTKFTLFTAIALVSSMSAFAECKQANFTSADGSKISIHYSSFNQTNGNTAWINPALHVTLSGDRCGAAKSVDLTLVLAPSENCGGKYAAASDVVTLNQDSPGSCSYSLLSGVAIMTASHCGAPDHDVAVKINYWNNSEWLVDPVSGGHNFEFSINDYYSPTTETCN